MKNLLIFYLEVTFFPKMSNNNNNNTSSFPKENGQFLLAINESKSNYPVKMN